MRPLPTRVDQADHEFVANRSWMLERLDEFEALLAQARAGGGEKYVARHRSRGKLLARERIEMLLDRDSPFLELSTLAAWGSDKPLGANVVTGIGVVSGVESVISAHDPTSQAGSSNRYSLAKSLRAQDIAMENRLPSGQSGRVRWRRSARPSRGVHHGRQVVPQPHPAVKEGHPNRSPSSSEALLRVGRTSRPCATTP